MAGRGPAPMKARESKRRPNATPGFTQLPFEGRRGDPPDWPLDGPTNDEANQWKKLWGLPQAVMWERMRCEDTVALYVRAYCLVIQQGSDPKMLNEVRQLDSKLGLSPRALLDLRWEIEAPADDLGEAPAHDHYKPAFVPDSQ